MKVNEFLQKAKNEISDNPESRIPASVKTIMHNDEYMYDAHMHIFDKECAAKNYFLLHLIEKFDEKESVRDDIIEILYKRELDNEIDDLFRIMDFNSMSKVLNYYIENFAYQKKMIYAPLMVDLNEWILKPKKSIHRQINELKRLMNNYPVLPFHAVDPYQNENTGINNLYNLFLHAFTGHNKFTGIKLYPALGFLPSHPALMPIYEICQEKNIPVTTHCGGTIIRTNKNKILLQGFQIVNNQVVSYQGKLTEKGKDKAIRLNDAALWEPVLKTYPKLKLNLGHFGGGYEWSNYPMDTKQNRIKKILELMQTYKNVYTDFSYNLSDKKIITKFFDTITNNENKPFLERVMFGTDYWMVLAAGDYFQNQVDFMDEASNYGVKDMITLKNPRKFLLQKAI